MRLARAPQSPLTCFTHPGQQRNTQRNAHAARRRSSTPVQLPVLEGANFIPPALMQVMHLLHAGEIERKSPSLLFSLRKYALQTASANLRPTEFSPQPEQIVFERSAIAEQSSRRPGPVQAGI
jgi:hypothetical protein